MMGGDDGDDGAGAENGDDEAARKASNKEVDQKASKKEVGPRAIEHGDAITIAQLGSHNVQTGRMDIQATCLMGDGSTRTSGICDMYTKEGFETQVWKIMLEKMRQESGEPCCNKGCHGS